MPTEAELMQGLRAADAAGDKTAASRFAGMIQEQRAKPDEYAVEAERLGAIDQQERSTVPTPQDEIDQQTGEVNPEAATVTSTVDDLLPMALGTGAYAGASALTKTLAKPVARAVGGHFPKVASKVGGWLAPKVAGGAAGGAVEEGAAGRDPVTGALYGAMLGPAIEGGMGLATKGTGALLDLTKGTEGTVTRKLRELFPDQGGRRQAVVDALRNPTPTGVVGEQSTVGSLTTPEFPEFGALEAMYRRRPGANRFTAIDAQNAEARANMLEPSAQFGRKERLAYGDTRRPLSAAEQLRADASRPLYEQSSFDRMTIPARLNRLLGAADVQNAITAGHRTFADARKVATAKGGKAFPRAATVDKLGNIQDISIGEMDAIRKELDTLANKAFQSTDPSVLARAKNLADVRDQLTAQMERQSPVYKQSREVFKQHSPLVNETQLMEELTKRLRNPYGNETPGNFGDALRNQEQTIKAAADAAGTRPRATQFEQQLPPEQLAKVNAVGESLRRKQLAETLPKNEGMLGNQPSMLEQASDYIPQVFSQEVTTARRALKIAGAKMGKSEEKLLGDAIADPKMFARLLETVPPSERPAVVKLFKTLQVGTGAAGTSYGVNNELKPYTEQ